MSNDDIAAAVLECVGGFGNVAGNSLCATRLRISLNDTDKVDRNALHSINGVLGVADRGTYGIEVVFGPNLVRGVYQAFDHLTGPMVNSQSADATVPTRKAGNFHVNITPETPGRPQIQASVSRPTVTPSPVIDDDTNALLNLLGQSEEPDDDELGMRLLVINGPNINMLGVDRDDPHAEADFADLLELCQESATEAGFSECECYQSNHEGDLIDRVQDAYEVFDAIVINPGPYAHTSIALHDALSIVGIPTIEVNLGDVAARAPYRELSYVRNACVDYVCGIGIEGYRKAIFMLAEHLGMTKD